MSLTLKPQGRVGALAVPAAAGESDSEVILLSSCLFMAAFLFMPGQPEAGDDSTLYYYPYQHPAI